MADMDRPRVSVIIPTYNRAQFIEAAIVSVLEQTFSDYEIIIVDDGSTDNTRQVVEPYLDRAQYVYQENGGAGMARNHGLRLARGEYIAFLDSDDLFMPHKLERQIAYLEANPAVGLVYAGHEFIHEDGRYFSTQRVRTADAAYPRLMADCRIALPSVLVRRSVLDAVGGFDETMRIGQDVDLWLRIARHFPVGVIEEPVTRIRRHASNSPRTPDDLRRTYFRLIEQNLDRQRLSAVQVRQIYARTYYRLGNEYLSAVPPDLKAAAGCWRRGLAQWPLDRLGAFVAARLVFRWLVPAGLRARLRGSRQP